MDINVIPLENPNAPHILLVNDDPVTLEQMALSFERKGYLVTCSTTGFEADILLKEYPDAFDVVLVNHSIPGMSGIESTISAGILSHDTPFFLNMELAYFVNVNRLPQTGITNIAGKPFNIDDLDSVIKRVISEKAEVCL